MREMWFKMGIKSGRASLKEKKRGSLLSLLAHCKDFPFTNTWIIEAA